MEKRVRKSLEALRKKIPLSFVCLFGSYAKENYTASSDRDLLIVYKGKTRKDAFGLLQIIPISL